MEKNFSFALGASKPAHTRGLGYYPGIFYSKPFLVVTESLGQTILHVLMKKGNNVDSIILQRYGRRTNLAGYIHRSTGL